MILTAVVALCPSCARPQDEIAVDNWCSALDDAKIAVGRILRPGPNDEDEFWTPTEALNRAVEEDMTEAVRDDRLPPDQAQSAANIRNAYRDFGETWMTDEDAETRLARAVARENQAPECE